MTKEGRYMFSVLMLSTVLMTLNIVAVSSGIADDYYSQLSEWLNNL